MTVMGVCWYCAGGWISELSAFAVAVVIPVVVGVVVLVIVVDVEVDVEVVLEVVVVGLPVVDAGIAVGTASPPDCCSSQS